MKRVALFGMVAAMIVSARAFLVAQSGPGGKQEPSIERPAVKTLPPTGLTSVLGPTTPLQQWFMELSAKKAHLMTEEQLQQGVKDLDREVAELNAWSKVEEAARLLREVEEKHPHTKAAEVANSAVGIIDRNRPTISPPTLEPASQPAPIEAAPFPDFKSPAPYPALK